MKKHWPCSYNRPVPDWKTRPAKSFLIDTVREMKVQLNCEVLQRGGLSIPMCDQSTAVIRTNMHTTRARHHKEGALGYTLSSTAYTCITATDRRWTIIRSSTHQFKKNDTLIMQRSSSFRCVSAAEHHTAEQWAKTGRTKPPKASLSLNTRQDFLKIPSLWEAALVTERRCFSKEKIFSSNVMFLKINSKQKFC